MIIQFPPKHWPSNNASQSAIWLILPVTVVFLPEIPVWLWVTNNVKGLLRDINLSNVRLDFSTGLIIMTGPIVIIRCTLQMLTIITLFSVERFTIIMVTGFLAHAHMIFDTSVVLLRWWYGEAFGAQKTLIAFGTTLWARLSPSNDTAYNWPSLVQVIVVIVNSLLH